MANNSFKKALRNPQNIIALGVTLISVCALVVSILQTRIMSEQRVLMHEQAKASVWPRVSFGVSRSFDANRKLIDYYLTISNDGVGPALVSGVRVSYKDEVASSWKDLFAKFDMADSIKTTIDNTSFNYGILKISDDFKILDLKNNLPLAQAYSEHAKHIKFEILYESIYGDKWLFTSTQKEGSTESVTKKFEFLAEEQFNG